MKHFHSIDDMAIVQPMPRFDALARGLILFRAHSPKGQTPTGLWLARNPNHPKIWGWAVGVHRGSEIPLGSMVVVERNVVEPFFTYASFDTEQITYLLPERAVHLVIDPPLIQMPRGEPCA